MPSRRQFLLGYLGVGALATPVGWYGAVYEPGDIEVVRRTATIRNLPTRLDGLTAVQVSDFHLHGIDHVHREMVDQVKALKPDVIFVTGDLVDHESAVGDALELLQSLKPPRGTWVVPGNWDHSSNSVELLSIALKSAGIRMLINEGAQLDDRFWVVGADDPTSELDEVSRATRDVPTGSIRILLAHSPDIAPSVRDSRFDLILVGHTHGGQINLPGLSGTWVKEGASREYVRGLYEVHGSPLYVNRGIGTTTLPLRIGSRPEITHFTFHAA